MNVDIKEKCVCLNDRVILVSLNEYWFIGELYSISFSFLFSWLQLACWTMLFTVLLVQYILPNFVWNIVWISKLDVDVKADEALFMCCYLVQNNEDCMREESSKYENIPQRKSSNAVVSWLYTMNKYHCCWQKKKCILSLSLCLGLCNLNIIYEWKCVHFILLIKQKNNFSKI